MVTTRYQSKRRRLDMDSAIGRREGSENNVNESDSNKNGISGDRVAENTGNLVGDSIPPRCKVEIVKLEGCSYKRIFIRRTKKRSFNAFKPREKNESVSSAHDCTKPESHDTFLHVGPVGEMGEGRRQSVSAIGHEYFRFRCPLGDVWHDAYSDVCRHRNIKTGDPWIDKVLRTIPFQGFDITHFVGTGKFSQVLAGNASQKIEKYSGMVAVKIFKRDKESPREAHYANKETAPWHVDFPTEVDIHRKLNHPNIAKWLDYMTYMQRRCIVMEFCHLGALKDLIEATPGHFLIEEAARKYFIQMVAAIEYIHSLDVVHRDVVCSNWVIDRHNVIKLIDFGCACYWSPSQPYLSSAPPSDVAYLPPEPLFGEPYNPKTLDIWALGVVLFKMLTSRLPFGLEPVFHQGEMTNLPYPKDSILTLSHLLKEMLNKILHPHLPTRFTLNRIKQSAWMKKDINKFCVSNHYVGRQPLKIKEGALERRWKRAFGLLKPVIVHKAWEPPASKTRVIKVIKVKRVSAAVDQKPRPNSVIGLAAELVNVPNERDLSTSVDPGPGIRRLAEASSDLSPGTAGQTVGTSSESNASNNDNDVMEEQQGELRGSNAMETDN